MARGGDGKMAVREDVKQTRKRGSEPKGQGSAERDTAEPATNAEDQGRVDGVREILLVRKEKSTIEGSTAWKSFWSKVHPI